MRVLIASMLLVSACAGPGLDVLAETPTATTPRTPEMPPPASVDDDERYWVTRTLNEVEDAQQMYREAGDAPAPTPPRQVFAPLPPEGAQPSPAPAAPDRT